MRFLLLLAALTPALAQASVDFKCESVKSSEKVNAWMRFSSSGREGNLEIEFWNEYPPITVLDAKMQPKKNGSWNWESALDGTFNAQASLSLPEGFFSQGSYLAQVELRTPSVQSYTMHCVRH